MATNKAAVLALLGPSGVSSGSRVATWENSSGYNRGLVLPDGSTRLGSYILGALTTPFIMLPGNGATAGVQFDAALTDGTFAIVGAVTLPTVHTYPRSAYCYFPASQIAGTSNAAGWYYTIFSSVSAGKVYNELYTPPGVPPIPSSPTEFSGVTNSAWLTQGITLISGQAITIPGGALGPNGQLWAWPTVEQNNSVGTKTLYLKLASTNVYAQGLGTGYVGLNQGMRLCNLNNQSKQMGHLFSNNATFGTNAGYEGAVDTSADQILSFHQQLATNTDVMAVYGGTIIINPGA